MCPHSGSTLCGGKPRLRWAGARIVRPKLVRDFNPPHSTANNQVPLARAHRARGVRAQRGELDKRSRHLDQAVGVRQQMSSTLSCTYQERTWATARTWYDGAANPTVVCGRLHGPDFRNTPRQHKQGVASPVHWTRALAQPQSANPRPPDSGLARSRRAYDRCRMLIRHGCRRRRSESLALGSAWWLAGNETDMLFALPHGFPLRCLPCLTTTAWLGVVMRTRKYQSTHFPSQSRSS